MNGDKRIFEGLEISKETALCGEHMGKYPVISISLKGMDALTYETAFQMAVQIVIEAAEKFYFLLDSEKLKEHDKAEYRKLLDDHMNEGMACSSLRKLSGLLEKHYGTKAVLLIDEYDVLNYCDSLFDDREAQPENYWINTSGNDAVKQFIRESSNVLAKREIECLVAGETVTKEIHQYPGYGCKKRNEGKFLSWYFAWNPWGEGPLGGPPIGKWAKAMRISLRNRIPEIWGSSLR